MVQVLASNLEQLVSCTDSMLSQLPHNTYHRLGQAGVIYSLGGYIG